MKTNKLLRLPKDNFDQELEFIQKNKHRIKEFIVCYTIEDKEDGKRNIGSYWFGAASCIMCLGLIQHMKDRISDYIKENWDFLDKQEL